MFMLVLLVHTLALLFLPGGYPCKQVFGLVYVKLARPNSSITYKLEVPALVQ